MPGLTKNNEKEQVEEDDTNNIDDIVDNSNQIDTTSTLKTEKNFKVKMFTLNKGKFTLLDFKYSLC
jgi:hypothetical protein